MNFTETSVKDSKQLKVHQDIRKDPLFQSLMSVCRNDEKYLQISIHESALTVSRSFFDCFGFWIPLFLLQVFFELYFKYFINSLYRWQATAIIFTACLLSVCISLITSYISKLSTFVNVAGVIVTFVYYKQTGEIRQPFFLLITVLLVVRILMYLPSIFKHKKMLEENRPLLLERKNAVAEFETLYELTSNQLDLRIKHCSEELQRNGFEYDFSKQHFWWKNHELRYSLSESGDLFDDEHVGRYESHSTYDQYDFTGEVIGKKECHYYYTCSKEFFMQKIPESLKENVFNHIKEKNFDNFCHMDLNSINKGSCSIIAIGCNWTSLSDGETKTTMQVNPTKEQIEEARREINRREDTNERLRNAYFKGVPMTTEELDFLTGGKAVSIQDRLDSDNRRSYAMDKFLNKSSYEDVSQEKLKTKENKHGTVFMYIIDNNVFFNKGAPSLYTGKRTYSGGKNWICNRDEEIEEALNYLIKHDSKFAIDLANKIWGGFEDEYHTKLASKIYHTIANITNYDKYFN